MKGIGQLFFPIFESFFFFEFFLFFFSFFSFELVSAYFISAYWPHILSFDELKFFLCLYALSGMGDKNILLV